jgi:hypothetical protein
MDSSGLHPRVLRKALEVVGNEGRLADTLGISPADLAVFLAGTREPVKSVFLIACDILLEHGQGDFLKSVTAQSRQRR